MIRKLIPVFLILIGLGIGVGAGLFLRPTPDAVASDEAGSEQKAEEPDGEPEVPPEYVKLNNQFVVPVMSNGRVISMVILSLSLEVEACTSQEIYAREPKLRDLFLQVLFDHANAGGFQGSFTDGSNLILLRKSLFEASSKILGEAVKDVLISDIARQDS